MKRDTTNEEMRKRRRMYSLRPSVGLTTGSGGVGEGYSLYLDFVNQEYGVNGTGYALISMPGYTFARTNEQGAEDSTGAVGFYSTNTPAINDRGYHAYPSLTNHVLHSNSINAAGGWGTFAGTSFTSTDTGVAPDGTTTAEENYFSGGGQIYQTITAGPVGFGTLTAYARLKTGTGKLRLKAFNGATDWPSSEFNIDTSWNRLVYNVDLGAGTHFQHSIQNQVSGTPQDIELWGAQLIEGNLADGGPIIRTTSAKVTLGASVMSFSVPSGSYTATYTFSDDSTQVVATTVTGDTYTVPTNLNKNVIKLITLE